MRSRGILLRYVAAALAVGSLLTSATVANADSVGSQQAKVNQLADQLDNLENRLGQLGEDYAAAQDQKDALDQEIADSQARIAQQQARLDQLAGVLGTIAVDKYVNGTSLELSPLFSNAAAYSQAEQKNSLSQLALDNGSGSTDEMLALAEDLAKEQASLSRKQQKVADLVTTLDSKLAEAQTLQGEFEQKLAEAKSQLGDLIDQERLRRAQAAAAAEIAKQNAASAASAAAASKKSAVSTAPRGSGNAGGTAPSGADPATGGGAPAVDPAPAPSAPPVSSAAGMAVSAALSQIGVAYQFAAESPGVAFDCSGLTKYAWGQAGVYLPHQSGAQYGSIAHISRDEIQPGDLIFYRTPIGHVAMYIGGGSLVQATRPGDVVKTGAVNWTTVVGVGRPG